MRDKAWGTALVSRAGKTSAWFRESESAQDYSLRSPGDAKAAVKDYVTNRQNGLPDDIAGSQEIDFLEAATFTWVKANKLFVELRYHPSKRVQAWMKETDDNYLARLERERLEKKYSESHSTDLPASVSLLAKLRMACRAGELEAVNALLEAALQAGFDPHDNAWGDTPLHEACRVGHIGIVDRLLEPGADPCVAGAYGNTPLYEACRPGADHLAVVERLLAQAGGAVGEMVHQRNDKSKTPFSRLVSYLKYAEDDDISQMAAMLALKGAVPSVEELRELTQEQWSQFLVVLSGRIFRESWTGKLPILDQLQEHVLTRQFRPNLLMKTHKAVFQRMAANRMDCDDFQLRAYSIQSKALEAHRRERFFLLHYRGSSYHLSASAASETVFLDQKMHAELVKQCAMAAWVSWQSAPVFVSDDAANRDEYTAITDYFLSKQSDLFHLYAHYKAIERAEIEKPNALPGLKTQRIAESLAQYLAMPAAEKWDALFEWLYHLSTVSLETEEETAAYCQLLGYEQILLDAAKLHFSNLLRHIEQPVCLEQYVNTGPKDDVLLGALREQACLRELYFLNLDGESRVTKQLIHWERSPHALKGRFLVSAGATGWYHKVSGGLLDFQKEADRRFAHWIRERLEERVLLDGALGPLIQEWIDVLRDILQDGAFEKPPELILFLDGMILYWQGSYQRYFQNVLPSTENRENLLIESLNMWEWLSNQLLTDQDVLPASVTSQLNRIHKALLAELETLFKMHVADDLPDPDQEQEKQKKLDIFVDHFKDKLQCAVRNAEVLMSDEVARTPTSEQQAIRLVSHILLGLPAALELLIVLGKESNTLPEWGEDLSHYAESAPELGHALEGSEAGVQPLADKMRDVMGLRSLENQWTRVRQAFTWGEEGEFINYLAMFVANTFSSQLACLADGSISLLAHWSAEQLVNGIRLIDLLEKMKPLKTVEEKAEFFIRFLMRVYSDNRSLLLRISSLDGGAKQVETKISVSDLFRFEGVRCHSRRRGEDKVIFLSPFNATEKTYARTRCALPSEIRADGKVLGWYR